MNVYKICLVEDEISLNNLIKSYMEKEGYDVIQFYKGNDALEYIGKEKIDLWILDIMLGDSISGYDLIKKIRSLDKNVPVIFTSARDQDLDKILGLELGSDDYIAKPYSPKELMLRINNILKRVYTNSNIIKYDDYEIDIDKRIVLHNNKEINLTTLEFDLLYMFLSNKGKSYSRDDILNIIWGENYFGSDRVVDDLIRRLRRKKHRVERTKRLLERYNIIPTANGKKTNFHIEYSDLIFYYDTYYFSVWHRDNSHRPAA